MPWEGPFGESFFPSHRHGTTDGMPVNTQQCCLLVAALLFFFVCFCIDSVTGLPPAFGVTTIAQAYAAFPNVSKYDPPGDLGLPNARTIQVTYNGAFNSRGTVVVNVGPSYSFNCTTLLECSGGQEWVPSQLVFPFPYCASSALTYNTNATMGVTTPGCEAPLIYGENYLPSLADGYPDFPVQPQFNGNYSTGFDNVINPAFAAPLDQGTPAATIGTYTWNRPSTCANPNPSFQLSFAMTGIYDTVVSTAVAYTDSATNITAYMIVFGLSCDFVPRPPTSPQYNPVLVVTALCKNLMPFNASYNYTQYQQLFGAGYIGPLLPLYSIVYQVRVDNLKEPGAILIWLRFTYVQGSGQTTSIVGPLVVHYDNIFFIASQGGFPAQMDVRAYSAGNPFGVGVGGFGASVNEATQTFNLGNCNCGTNPSVVCFPNNTMETSVPRMDVPNYNVAVPYLEVPSCIIFVNSQGPPFPNGSNPAVGAPFKVTAGNPGFPVTYAWQLTNLPPSAGFITPPANTQIVTVTINAPGQYSIGLIIATVNVAVICNATFTVANARPIAVIVPTFAVTLASQPVTLDGTGSISPDTSPLTFLWSIPFQPAGGDGNLDSTSASVVVFTANVIGFYSVYLNVTNDRASAGTQARIQVVAMLPPVSPPNTFPPVSGAPLPCNAQLPPTTFALNPNAGQPLSGGPVTPFPPSGIAPGSVAPPNPFPPGVNPSAFVGPAGIIQTSQIYVIVIAIVLAVIVCLVALLTQFCKNNTSEITAKKYDATKVQRATEKRKQATAVDEKKKLRPLASLKSTSYRKKSKSSDSDDD